VGTAAEPVGIPAQDLAAIRGIGPVFEQKFYSAGIGTYAELAALSDAEIEAIIQPKEWQDFDYESWNEQARQLIPDDLSKIRGIGDVFKQKLYEAGIMTFADLAAATVAQLEAIIQPQEWQEVDFAGWVAQARDPAL
jgi:predicted flap endonuclease-1-like 5' DNA nuclease